jgi:hypothetical protein
VSSSHPAEGFLAAAGNSGPLCEFSRHPAQITGLTQAKRVDNYDWTAGSLAQKLLVGTITEVYRADYVRSTLSGDLRGRVTRSTPIDL